MPKRKKGRCKKERKMKNEGRKKDRKKERFAQKHFPQMILNNRTCCRNKYDC